MARNTPKKNHSASGSGSLLNFFQKSDGASSTSTTIKKPAKSAKVDSGKSQGSYSIAVNGKGKGKAIDGTAFDPVVISDDDDIVEVTPAPKKSSVARVRPAEEVEVDDDLPGPSVRKRSPSPQVPPQQSPPNPFPNLPGFKQPPTWPQIVNTADIEEDSHLSDGDGSVKAPSEAGDASDDEDRMQDPEILEDEDFIVYDADEKAGSKLDSTSLAFEADPRGSMGGLDMDMVWDEPEDEGMGMEEEGDDDLSEVIATPPPVSMKRKRGPANEKVDECPVCQRSLKGKPNAVIQNHINSCLDSPRASSSTPNRAARPITSIGHSFSPAPSTPSPPPEEVSKGPNAFSVLMSGHKEKEQWKDAEIDLKRDGKRTFGRRKAPFYKVLSGMPVAVDAFRYGAVPKVKAYLLTHAHSDHYTNLSKSWKEGPIYCSETTANLIVHMLGVERKWVHGLPDNVPFVMPNTGGVTVTPIEANHCPGSSIFLFEGPQTVNAGDSTFKSPYVGSKRIFRYLHCGDFRACPKMILHPAIARAKIDTCYLDTTYLNPKYCFPPQPQVIEACALLARKVCVGISHTAPPLDDIKGSVKAENADKFDVKPDINAVREEAEGKSKALMTTWLVKRESEDGVKMESEPDVKMEPGMEVDQHQPEVKRDVGDVLRDVKPDTKRDIKVKPTARTLVVMGTYSIGKERIVKAVAKALGSKIYCDPRKRGILLCQTDEELHSMMDTDPIACQVHLLPLGNIQLDALQPYLARLHPHFDRIIGFRPTGWSYSPPAGTETLPDINMVIRRDQSRVFTDASLKPMRGSCRQFMMYGVPYSEHSSFFELTCFALSLPCRPEMKMIATVNVGNEKSRAKMKKWFEKWAAEKVKRKEKNLPAIVDYRDETYW